METEARLRRADGEYRWQLIRAVPLRDESGKIVNWYGASADVEDLVLDVHLPGLSGLDLQKRMAEADIEIPIIFITGRGDIPTAVRAMKADASDHLPNTRCMALNTRITRP